MNYNNKKNQQLRHFHSKKYFSILVVLSLFSFFQVSSVKAQTAIESNKSNQTTIEETVEELDWNVGTEATIQDDKKNEQLEEQTALGWEKWDAAHTSDGTTTVYEYNEEEIKETKKVKSPNEILMASLIGNWEGFYGGSKAYISFKENKTVTINTSIFFECSLYFR